VYGRKTLGRSTSYGYGCFTIKQWFRIYNCRRYTNRACFIAGTQIITGQKTFSEDIIVGSTASQVYTQISTL
jgi:hypothetical protein